MHLFMSLFRSRYIQTKDRKSSCSLVILTWVKTVHKHVYRRCLTGFVYCFNLIFVCLFIATCLRRNCKEPGARFSKVPRTFRARKAIRKTTTCSFCKAGLLICCKGNKNKNNCKVSCLETPSFWRYKENYVTRNTPEKFRDFRETGPCSLGNHHVICTEIHLPNAVQ